MLRFISLLHTPLYSQFQSYESPSYSNPLPVFYASGRPVCLNNSLSKSFKSSHLADKTDWNMCALGEITTVGKIFSHQLILPAILPCLIVSLSKLKAQQDFFLVFPAYLIFGTCPAFTKIGLYVQYFLLPSPPPPRSVLASQGWSPFPV